MMKLPGVAWRALTGYDMDALAAIATAVHPGFYEAPETLAERQRLYHNGTYLLEVGERPAGYVLSHPWRFAEVPALNTMLGEIPRDADTYYIHDLALLPLARRIGAASFIVEALAKHAAAQGYATMSLVAVNASEGFWERHGFAVADASDLAAHPGLAEKLASYEAGARFMVRRLDKTGAGG